MKTATATCDFMACSTSSSSSRTLASSATTYPPPPFTSFSKENCRFSLPVPPSPHLSIKETFQGGEQVAPRASVSHLPPQGWGKSGGTLENVIFVCADPFLYGYTRCLMKFLAKINVHNHCSYIHTCFTYFYILQIYHAAGRCLGYYDCLRNFQVWGIYSIWAVIFPTLATCS